MTKKENIAIIPARFESTRFPGKPLIKIGNQLMIERVCKQVIKSKKIDLVLVATDDYRIKKAVEATGFQAIMTSKEHLNGTSRCWEVYEKLNLKAEIILNIQGDEPFIKPEQIDALIDIFEENNEAEIGTLVKEIDDLNKLKNPNVVKAILGIQNRALYFSRAAIPFQRNEKVENWLKNSIYFKHLGVYAFRANVLKKLVQLKPSPLEQVEALEQLRWLENGYKIFAKKTNFESLAIDTPEDYENAKKYLNR